MAEKEKVKKRIAGPEYWKLMGLMKELQKLQVKLNEWAEEKAEEMQLYPDQINWNTGSIFDPLTVIVNGKIVEGKVISRLERKAFNEHKKKVVALKKKDDEIGTFREGLAKKLNIWPDMIDFKTGVISGDYEEVAMDKKPDGKEEEKKDTE